MASKTVGRRWIGAACVALATSALAEDLPTTWRDLDQLRAHFAGVPERELERLFLRCSRESSERMMAFGEAALCSAGFEALKNRKFGGDFNALLAWWRLQRSEPPAAPGVPARNY